MKEIMIQKLHHYLRENNPETLQLLEEEGKITTWLADKIKTVESLLAEYDGEPEYIIEEVCMNELTKDLRPSKFNYISNILAEEFEDKYEYFLGSGTLIFEGLNLVSYCQPVFDDLHFNQENENNRFIKYAITGAIREYLDK